MTLQNHPQLPSIKFIPARQSTDSPFQTHLVYVDANKIGTHENVDKQKFLNVLTAILKEGYKGPAITVMGRNDDSYYKKSISSHVVDDLEYGNLGIIDGHNRLAVYKILAILDLLKTKLIPVEVFPVWEIDSAIKVSTLNRDEEPLSLEAIASCFNDKNKIIPQCTSHFRITLKTGESVRARDSQQDLIIERGNLLDLKKLEDIKQQVVAGKLKLTVEQIESINEFITISDLENVLKTI